MKLLREALIIFGIYLLGELLSTNLHLHIPGNILGMIILFLLLSTKIIKIENIEDISNFLLKHLAFFFIPAGVGLICEFDAIKSEFIQIFAICILTTFLMISVTGRVVQFIKNKKFTKEVDTIGHNN